MNDSAARIVTTIFELDIENIQTVVQNCLDEEVPPWKIVEAMSRGMEKVGEKFEAGDYYLAELILSGEMMKEGMKLLESKSDENLTGQKGTVIVATAKGDIHDIGKDIVGTMLSAAGFKVIDLGVDCHEDKIIEAVKASGSRMIALSVLLTTMIGSISDLITALGKSGLRDNVKIAIGGACCSQALADEIGADAFGEDAIKAVKIFDRFAGLQTMS
jgi:methylmalonyl-CoA mutase cobalamin-binding domain/chain